MSIGLAIYGAHDLTGSAHDRLIGRAPLDGDAILTKGRELHIIVEYLGTESNLGHQGCYLHLIKGGIEGIKIGSQGCQGGIVDCSLIYAEVVIHRILEIGIAYVAGTADEVVGSSSQVLRFEGDVARYGKVAIDIDFALAIGLAIGDGVPITIGEGRLADGECLLVAPMGGTDSIARIRHTGTEEDATVGCRCNVGRVGKGIEEVTVTRQRGSGGDIYIG